MNTQDRLSDDEQLSNDFKGKTFNLEEWGFKDAAEYLVKLESRYGRMFVPAHYDKEKHTITIWFDDSV